VTEVPVILDPRELVEYLTSNPPDYSCDDLLTMLLRVGRNHGPFVVAQMHWHGALFRKDAQAVVPDVWSGVEHPLQAADTDVWRDLFDFAGYTYNGRRRAKPRISRVLYRGADQAHRDGWSWTDDRKMAQWFADRTIHHTPGQVWQATVEPARLMARITSSRAGENEWVVDTEDLVITRVP
jgi:hypothetical protein